MTTQQSHLFAHALADGFTAHYRGGDFEWHAHNAIKLHRECHCETEARIELTTDEYDDIDRDVTAFWAEVREATAVPA